MRHFVLAVCTYWASVATIAKIGTAFVQPLWLDLMLLAAVYTTAGQMRARWCWGLGLLMEVLAPQVPGSSILIGATCAWALTTETEPRRSPVSGVSLAWALLLCRVGQGCWLAQPVWPLLTGTVLTLLTALLLDQWQVWREERRSADLQLAVSRPSTIADSRQYRRMAG